MTFECAYDIWIREQNDLSDITVELSCLYRALANIYCFNIEEITRQAKLINSLLEYVEVLKQRLTKLQMR